MHLEHRKADKAAGERPSYDFQLRGKAGGQMRRLHGGKSLKQLINNHPSYHANPKPFI
jgi:hypothetical protein